MSVVEVKPYSDLQPQERPFPNTNWMAEATGGQLIPDWTSVVDSRYGSIQHVLVTDSDGNRFDKVNLQWSPAVFIVVTRRNPEKQDRVEFLLPLERRPLLRNPNGVQGNEQIRNIPQGLVKTWRNEETADAVLREVKEETGLVPTSVVYLDELFFDAANSETAMPFFLAEVPYERQEYKQALEPTEAIEVGEESWFAIEDIPALKLQCAKTLAGIMVATGYLGMWINQKTEAK